MNVKVKNLKKNGNEFSWTIIMEDDECDYHTDEDGHGIWVWDRTWWGQQFTGTGQFSLHNYSISGARKKIKRYYEKKFLF